MNGIRILTSHQEKDVGVIISDSLRLTSHCQDIARKATYVLYQISRAFHFRDKHISLKLYKTYVRCHLEYASPVWSPWLRSDIETIGEVQRKMVALIPGLTRT